MSRGDEWLMGRLRLGELHLGCPLSQALCTIFLPLALSISPSLITIGNYSAKVCWFSIAMLVGGGDGNVDRGRVRWADDIWTNDKEGFGDMQCKTLILFF